jgi:hypothetical protein
MDITQQEQQMLELLREWAGGDQYRLLIERQDGAWDITLSEVGKPHTARGTGATFGEAWDDMAPTWAC